MRPILIIIFIVVVCLCALILFAIVRERLFPPLTYWRHRAARRVLNYVWAELGKPSKLVRTPGGFAHGNKEALVAARRPLSEVFVRDKAIPLFGSLFGPLL